MMGLEEGGRKRDIAIWHLVGLPSYAIMHAAGVARSWRSNRANALQDYEHRLEKYEEKLALYEEQQARETLEEGEEALEEPKAPVWHEWNIPSLRVWCLQCNANVVQLEASEDSSFDFWLKISTLEKGKPLLIPVKLAEYHKEILKDKETGKRREINSSVSLNKRDGVWWLTITYDEEVAIETTSDAPVEG